MSSNDRDRRELPFWEHLDELRLRLMRSVGYITAGGIAGWVFREDILMVLQHPARIAAQRLGIEKMPFRVFQSAEGFVIAIQVALLSGLILAGPFVFYEIWRFIEPALEDNERKYAIVVLPFATILFLSGVVFCYYVSPNAFAFLFSMTKDVGAEVELKLKDFLWFLMRLLLAFGLAFELPLVTMFLGSIGVVNTQLLLSWWRQAIVGVFAFAAVVTPTPDPVNMTILAGPMLFLYFLSILLVWIVEKRRERREQRGAKTAAAAAGGDGGEAEPATDEPADGEQEQTPEDEGIGEDELPEEDVEIPPPYDDTIDEPEAPFEDYDLPEEDEDDTEPSTPDDAGEFYDG